MLSQIIDVLKTNTPTTNKKTSPFTSREVFGWLNVA